MSWHPEPEESELKISGGLCYENNHYNWKLFWHPGFHVEKYAILNLFAPTGCKIQLFILLSISSIVGRFSWKSSDILFDSLYPLNPIGLSISFNTYSATSLFFPLQSNSPIVRLSFSDFSSSSSQINKMIVNNNSHGLPYHRPQLLLFMVPTSSGTMTIYTLHLHSSCHTIWQIW